MRLRFHLLAIFSLLQFASLGQDNPVIFYEVIKDDSVVLFFNKRNHFIEKKCADLFRFTKVDVKGDFNGYYEDVSSERVVTSTGTYSAGKKHGYFEIYYPDGKLRCKGHYVNNVPFGLWEFFYENGLPERTIQISERDTLLMKFVNKKGDVTVDAGNGEFEGIVQANSIGASSVVAKGKIENGKPVGKWTSTAFNRVFCKEEFVQGKLRKGIFPNAVQGGNKEYHTGALLNSFFLTSYITLLESFTIEKCSDSTMYKSRKYSFDMNKFNSDLRAQISRIITGGRAGDYSIGDNILAIRFAINKEGRAEDFSLMTSWGQQFYDAITSSIKMQIVFPIPTKEMYFHFKLHFSGGFTDQYNFHFSKNKSFY